MLDDKSPVRPGEIVGGKYRVERVIGAGGMGVVVAATHVELGQSVALKFHLPQHDNVERFVREARVAVRLKSEHVARVYDVGSHEDRPYMVLELLEGLDLAKSKRRNGIPPVAEAVETIVQTCDALVEAHALGIVHRDLKPQNLFITHRRNGALLVKVLDFGISKAIGPAAVGQLVLTDSSTIMGSPLYMAPEQMRAARFADVRSDVWSLGVILYELLGGRVPFDGETVTEVCLRVVNEPPRPLAELRPRLDPRLVAVVMKCLEKDPAARYQTCGDLAMALEPFAASAAAGPARAWRSLDATQDPHAFASADETGPSTAVTLVRQPTASATPPPPPPPPSGRKEKNAAFGRGLVFGAIATLIAGVVAVLFSVSSSRTRSVGPEQVAAVSPPPVPSPSASASASVAPGASSLSALSAPPTASDSTPAIAVSALPSLRTARPKPAVAPATAAAAPPPGAETHAPNGAPILR
jgi:serine/threonine-protein kinase